ncbi:MAG: ABC transporter permease [Tepidisphaeraceae bacterium]
MSDDVVRAAIFLLILAVFFSICMERLVIASPNIYRQLVGVAVIFLLMCLSLYAFHPAFKISASPLIIILAFAIIFMSVFVIGVVYQKFDTELKKLRSGRGTSEGASFARGAVLTQAIFMGIANMRKRKIRTLLTGTTIVLITFAVLVFASATSMRSTTSLPAGLASDHPGVMMRQRGFRPLEQTLVADLRAVLGGNEKWKDVQVVERWWNANAGDPNEQVNLVYGGQTVNGKPAKVVALPALLGLTAAEGKTSAVAQVIGEEKFARLQNEQDIIFLSSDTVKQLGATGEGDIVNIAGFKLKIAGVYDAAEFDRKVYMLSGEPLSPLKYEANALDAGGKKLSDSGADQIELDSDSAGSELAQSYQHLPASQFGIVHARLSQQLSNARLASVALRTTDFDETKKLADEIASRFTLVIYAGLESGVQMISASNLAKITGSAVAIPLLIGGLIIFNTMMGSIAERKREIHIYTSLGLAPMHVGALFVAEALTYGVLGTVFGYIIGQGVGTFMLKMGWLGNMTLDYSGSSALLTIGLILLVVLLSALVPARLASKIAAPSIERSWRVPPPKDGRIVATLPFTINKTAAEGAIAYLAEFFDAHREGSIGKFAADRSQVFRDDLADRKVRGLSTTVWLTPFDLGVRQNITLLIQASESIPDVYEVQVLLDRLSGDDSSWYRMNRPFLTELRKQFLQWRSLSPARMKEYVVESRKLFETEAVAV